MRALPARPPPKSILHDNTVTAAALDDNDIGSAASSSSSASSASSLSSSPSRRASCDSTSSAGRKRPSPGVRFCSRDDVHVVERYEDVGIPSGKHHHRPPLHSPSSPRTSSAASPIVDFHQSPLPPARSMMYRFGALLLLLLAVLPFLHDTSYFGHASIPLQPVSGGLLPEGAPSPRDIVLDRRADSPTDVCFRWAQQSAIVNGTLYLYGGQATTEAGQTENTWNNNFLSLDLTKTWQRATPPLTGLPQPSGPPAVALGSLWDSHESLFLYGGQFSWKPVESPTPFSLWEYDIASSDWIEHSDPVTSSGEGAPSDGQPVQRSSEGAGISVPSLGRGFYFGGHEDGYTTEGWSQSIPRIYLQSLLEYTFPGYSNDQVNSLGNSQTAGSDGVYRNITEGGNQAQAGFTQRADGLLIYVPGFGKQGILLALAGGTNDTFTQMNNVDVYDIATSSWYVQATSGETPAIRVNPCAVIAAAPDGSSYNIYMFGGQNLIPYGNQTQYDDMWILTLPSFTWIQVDQSGQSVPYGRSGHTCDVWDGQMVMVGGYTGVQNLTCDTPGIYVFDMSACEWVNQFTAISAGDSDSSSSNDDASADTLSTGQNNPFNQQPAQKYSDSNPGGLEGSYGYEVPEVVIKVIGGDKTGGATLTTPVNTATAGPMATGKPITYTITNPDGSIATATSGSGSSSSNSGGSGTNVGAIVAGCVAGFFFILAAYLAFCAWVYRKQLQLYKRHVEMSQAQARGEKIPAIPGLLASNNAKDSTGTPSDPSYRRGDLGPWPSNNSERASSPHSRNESGVTPISPQAGGAGAGGAGLYYSGYDRVRRHSETSSTHEEDLLNGREPTFVGVVMNPRRCLRVINQD